VTGNFLEGLTALRSERYNDAQVSFRKVTELKQDWSLGWYGLCRASQLAHDDGEAGEAWARYDTLAPAEGRLARDGSTPCVLFMIESGQGPTRKANEIAQQLGSWEKTDSPEIELSLTPAGQKVLRSVKSKRTAWLSARLRQLDPDELEAIDAAIEPLVHLLEEDPA